MKFGRVLFMCILCVFAHEAADPMGPVKTGDRTLAGSGLSILTYDDLEIQLLQIMEHRAQSSSTLQLVHPVGYNRIVWKNQVFLSQGLTIDRITDDDSGWWFERITRTNVVFESWEELTSGPPFDAAARFRDKKEELGDRYRWRMLARTSDGLRYEASGDRSNENEGDEVNEEFATALRSSVPIGMGRALMVLRRQGARSFMGFLPYVVGLIKEEPTFSVPSGKQVTGNRVSLEQRQDLRVSASPLMSRFVAEFKTVQGDPANGLHETAFRIEDLTLEE